MTSPSLLERPSDDDCCGSGCSPCVFDVYEAKLRQLNSQNHQDLENPVLNDIKYSPFKLKDITAITSDTNIYTFQAVDEKGEPILRYIKLTMGEYLILKGLNKISRPYTPILNDSLKSGCFQVIIKLYKGGKMSEELKKMEVGELKFWRGPYKHLSLRDTKYLLLIGAGTGIVPLYNIAHELVINEEVDTFIKFFCCFETPDHILLREELKTLTDFWNFNLVYYFSQSETCSLRYREGGIFKKISKVDLEAELMLYRDNSYFIVVCGPDAFNSFCKNTFLDLDVDENAIAVL